MRGLGQKEGERGCTCRGRNKYLGKGGNNWHYDQLSLAFNTCGWMEREREMGGGREVEIRC